MSAKQVTVNLEQKLFVIHSNRGFSCLGFDVCERRTVALARELAAKGETIPTPAYFGTLERYAQYEAFCELARGWNTRTGWRSRSELTPELIGLEGKRVEVRHHWPESGTVEVSRFIVGKSTGFIPCHLEIKRRDSTGGAVCLGKILSVRIVA